MTLYKFFTPSCILVLLFFSLPQYSFAKQSQIIEADGYSCMGDEKSRKQTRDDALIDAKKKAVQHCVTYIKSETRIENAILTQDIIDAYTNADIHILNVQELGWSKDKDSGECFYVHIKAEVIPREEVMEKIIQGKALEKNPEAPLNVSVWTDKKEYSKGDKIKIYIRGNKPFFGIVLYKEANGNLVQLLPNPYRRDQYFNGGVVYEIPSGNDKFELEVRPPFGEEIVTLYASTEMLGEIELEKAKGVYLVKTKYDEVPFKTRGIAITRKKQREKIPAEFSEVNYAVKIDE